MTYVAFSYISTLSVTGLVWVFRLDDDVQYEDPDVNTYCERLLFESAFWSLMITFSVMLLTILLAFAILGISCFRACQGGADAEEQGTEEQRQVD